MRKVKQSKRFYLKLRAKIVEQGYTQGALAKEMGITEQALSNKLLGKTDFTLREVVEVCNILNADPIIFFDPSLHDLQFLDTARAQ